MSNSGDHKVSYAALADAAAGDQAEATAACYTCTDQSRPANWSRFTWLGVPLIAVVFVVVILVTRRASADLPFLPSFTVVSVTVRSLSLSTASSSVRSGDFSVTLAVRNPNTKADVRFRTLVAGVYYGGMVVAEAPLPPMYQAALAERTVTARLVASAAPRVERVIARGVRPDMALAGSGDVIRFRLEATCRLAFRLDGVETASWRKFMVRCGDVPIQLDNATAPSTSGKLVGPRRPCSVE